MFRNHHCKNVILISSLNLPCSRLKHFVLLLLINYLSPFSLQAPPKDRKAAIRSSQRTTFHLLAFPHWRGSPFLYYFCGSSLDLLQQSHVFSMLRTPELDVFQMGSHKSRAECQNLLPRPAGRIAFDVAQDTIGFLGWMYTFLGYVQPFIHQYPQNLSMAALHLFFLKLVSILGFELNEYKLPITHGKIIHQSNNLISLLHVAKWEAHLLN